MSSDDFVHDIAIDISRALNLTNPNDLIAKKVIQFAETNKDFDKFSKGKLLGIEPIWSSCSMTTLQSVAHLTDSAKSSWQRHTPKSTMKSKRKSIHQAAKAAAQSPFSLTSIQLETKCSCWETTCPVASLQKRTSHPKQTKKDPFSKYQLCPINHCLD